VHALRNSLQILCTIRPHLRLVEWEAMNRAIELVERALPDVAAMHEYVDVQEDNMRTLVEESNQTHRDLSSTHEKCAALLAMLHTANVRAAAAERGLMSTTAWRD
jgi:hypothetical protein